MNGSSQQQRPPYINDAEGVGFALWHWGITPLSKWDVAWGMFLLRGALGILGLTWGISGIALMFEDHPNGLELILILAFTGFSGWLSYLSLNVWLRASQQYKGERNAFIAARLAFYWDKPNQYPGGLKKFERDKRVIEGVYTPDD